MKRNVLLTFLIVAFVGINLQAQGFEVTGTVTSADDGSALPGVSVVVQGTTIGAVTDFNGKYSITVPQSAEKLMFSFIGMQTTVLDINGQTVIDVALTSSSTELDEVVVTALGISKERKSLGYSVQDVGGDEITQAREANFVNSLQGRVSGAQITSSSGAVGASSRIILRGVSNLGGNNQPLFVVDGIPISNANFGGSGNDGTNKGNGAGDVNPDDIETISVLKGANAAALYGSRASNGVIVITTKSGGDKKSLGVTVSNTTTFENPLRLPDYQNDYGQGSQGAFEFVNGRGGGTNDGFDESWGPRLDDGSERVQFDSPYDEATGTFTPTPWVSNPDNVKNFFETGVTTSTNVSLLGSGDKANFRLSYTDMNQKGMVPNTEYKKKTISWNANAKTIDKLEFSTSGQFVQASSENMPAYGYNGENVMQQFVWFGRQVDLAGLTNYSNPEGKYVEPIAGTNNTKYSWNYNYHNNPYSTLYENLNGLNRDRFIGNAMAKYQITDGLSAYVRTGGDFYSNLSTYRRAVGDVDFPSGFYSETLSTFSEMNTDFLVSYQKSFGDDIDFSLNAGGNRMDRRTQFNYGEASELAVPGIYNVKNSKVAIVADNGKTLKRVNSVYAFGQLGYKKALFLDFSIRKDWSSTLPEGKNGYSYPSVSVSAVLTDLLEIQSDVLSFAKIRAGYAEVGGDTDPYSLSPTVAFGDGWNSSTKLLNLAVPNTMPNDQLQPQRTKSFEAGADLSFFMNKVRLDLTYYNAMSVNQIISIPVSPTTGYTAKRINAGRIDNDGVEVLLGLTPVSTSSGFQWDITINWAKNNNEVVELYEGIDKYELGGYWSMDVMAIPGEKYGSLFGYDFERDGDGNIIYTNGLPHQGDLAILGNYTPDWVGGIMNEFSFKGVFLSALIDMRKGGDLYSMTSTWGRYSGILEETLIGREGGVIGDGVMLAADGTYVPNDVVVGAEDFNKSAYTNDVAYSSVFDASYIKLREVRAGYTFAINGVIQSLDLSIVGRNLAILKTSVPHIDPETAFSNGNVQGLEFGQLPSARSIGFNVSVKF